ncbi:transporter substrate-binding domain-containing protein [Pseudomonas lalucatii]|uniref:Transporter substrate-binding domain-containing protein n=1 Tax=Pseudomonas lalucatii TaxID=1424203 RepID=A0ABS5PYL9_9PSED|nr:transporter substrate-binding domain-containing protein [Pseudomonas lalucatii]MBS7661171.1 transporter substrate-binding domain-containing protein [Pseudomonas lalucatii]
MECSLRAVFRVLLVALSLLVVLPLAAEQRVAVGAYHFPPYVIKPESASPGGLLPELLAALNQLQDQYRFELVATSVTRRYRDLEGGRFDLILFESPNWGWQDTEHEALDLQVEDAEVYVARAEPGRDQSYFDRLKGKRLALYSGYHYGFADFNADQQFLAEEFGAVLTYSHDSNLIMLLRGRADIAVITRSYLQLYQERHPERRSALLVSQRVDQVYQHHALFRRQAPLGPDAFAVLLRRLQEQGQLSSLLGRYYLVVSPAQAPD